MAKDQPLGGARRVPDSEFVRCDDVARLARLARGPLQWGGRAGRRGGGGSAVHTEEQDAVEDPVDGDGGNDEARHATTYCHRVEQRQHRHDADEPGGCDRQPVPDACRTGQRRSRRIALESSRVDQETPRSACSERTRRPCCATSSRSTTSGCSRCTRSSPARPRAVGPPRSDRRVAGPSIGESRAEGCVRRRTRSLNVRRAWCHARRRPRCASPWRDDDEHTESERDHQPSDHRLPHLGPLIRVWRCGSRRCRTRRRLRRTHPSPRVRIALPISSPATKNRAQGRDHLLVATSRAPSTRTVSRCSDARTGE